MVTRERRHAYFCILQTHRFSKDLRVYWESPKKNHRTLIPAMKLPVNRNKFVLNIWLCQKFFVPLQPRKSNYFKNFIGMVTRESRHAYFCILQTPQISKDLRVYWESPKESSYPYSRHGFTIYTNNFEHFVQNIWLYQKFFVPLQLIVKIFAQILGMATRERRLCLVLLKDEG